MVLPAVTHLCTHSEYEVLKGKGHGASLLPKHNDRLATLVAHSPKRRERTNERTEPETLLLRAKSGPPPRLRARERASEAQVQE